MSDHITSVDLLYLFFFSSFFLTSFFYWFCSFSLSLSLSFSFSLYFFFIFTYAITEIFPALLRSSSEAFSSISLSCFLNSVSLSISFISWVIILKSLLLVIPILLQELILVTKIMHFGGSIREMRPIQQCLPSLLRLIWVILTGICFIIILK